MIDWQCTLKTAYKNTKKYQDIRGNVNTLLRKEVKELSTSTCHARHVDKNAGQRKYNVRQSFCYPVFVTRFYKLVMLKERRVDALALRADERRDKLRKASGRSKYPKIRRFLNGGNPMRRLMYPYANP